MEECHLDAVAQLEKECFSVPWSRDAFGEAVRSGDYEYVAALSEEGPVGYAGMQVVPDEAEVTNIAVKEAFRGLGIGERLMEALETICRRRGVRYLHLEVRESNEPARNLYKRRGFEIDGIRKNFYQKPQENAVLMTKIL